MNEGQRRGGDHFRHDVQGLRAIGAALIVVFHLWVGRVSGGVDVFFVLSGFLMTGVLVRQSQRDGRIKPLEFWGRIAQRILPTAFFIICVVLVLTEFALPYSEIKVTLTHAIASVLQLENLYLRRLATDYLAREDPPNAFQHFWALSVQIQTFAILPLILWATMKLAGAAEPAKKALRASIVPAGLACVSFGYALLAIERYAPAAYFDPAARLWEFMIGILCAIWAPRLALSASARRATGWLGLLLVLSCGFVLPADLAFPGFGSIAPVGGAALVLIAGTKRVTGDVASLLCWKPLSSIGRYGFTVYLWHWPLFVVAMHLTGDVRVSIPIGAVIIIASVTLAWLTHRFIEKPARQFRLSVNQERRPLLNAVSPLAVCAGLAAPVILLAVMRQEAIDRMGRSIVDYYERTDNAADVWETPHTTAFDLRQQLLVSRDLVPASYRLGCHSWGNERELKTCTFGSNESEYTILLIGGSHAAQWLPALRLIAEGRPIRIVNMTRSACRFGGSKPDCAAWNEKVLRHIEDDAPDLVFTTGTAAFRNGRPEKFHPAFEAAFLRMSEAGSRVVAIRDNPRPDVSVPACVARRRDVTRCGKGRQSALAEHDPSAAAADRVPNLALIDLTNAFCDEAFCPAVRDGYLIYRDNSHVAVPYVRKLAPRLEAEMSRSVPELSALLSSRDVES